MAVQLSFQGFGSDDVETRRLLRGEADADMVDDEEEEEEDGMGLGIAMIKVGAQHSRHRPWKTFGLRLRAILCLAWWYAGREEAQEGRDDAHA